ncbi:MAG TPA: hypothetical protein VJ890_08125 [Vineibacter sp.]|nr:hypothetical protein [Vineibacter sp.]
MIFSLDVRRARKGDCLLLHFGTRQAPGLVMIDGGPRGVYAPHLKPRIEQIRKARRLADNAPLDVNLLMVSHVDDDHIQGILDLTKELMDAKRARRPQAIRVLSLWHNSFDNVIGNPPAELTAMFKGQFGAASTSGEPPADLTVEADDDDLDEESVRASLMVLASIEQGARLRGEADALEFPLNPEFDGKLIVAAKAAVDVADGLTFTVAGPMQKEIKALHKKHEAWLKDLEKKGKSPSDALAAYVDTSVPNLSSVVVLAEAAGKRMLLTGDARGDKILQGLELTGRLKKGGKTHVDLLKVPHHGSARNLETDFFVRVTADHYVLSGNGEHGNPEREALEMLLEARGTADYAIHLTYPIAEIDAARQEDWKKERAKEQKRAAKLAAAGKKSKKPVRPEWSAEAHSLAALLARTPALAARVRIVAADKPHVIDLADPLGAAWPELVA